MVKCTCGHEFEPKEEDTKPWYSFKGTYHVDCPKCGSGIVIKKSVVKFTNIDKEDLDD